MPFPRAVPAGCPSQLKDAFLYLQSKSMLGPDRSTAVVLALGTVMVPFLTLLSLLSLLLPAPHSG